MQHQRLQRFPPDQDQRHIEHMIEDGDKQRAAACRVIGHKHPAPDKLPHGDDGQDEDQVYPKSSKPQGIFPPFMKVMWVMAVRNTKASLIIFEALDRRE